MEAVQASTSEEQTQYAHHAYGFAPQQKFGPAISEAAELNRGHAERGYLPLTSPWSEARPR